MEYKSIGLRTSRDLREDPPPTATEQGINNGGMRIGQPIISTKKARRPKPFAVRARVAPTCLRAFDVRPLPMKRSTPRTGAEQRKKQRIVTPPAIKKVKAQNKEWLGGSQQTVRWASEGDVAKVTILLTRPGARFLDMHLAFEVDNTGQHVVTVPRGLAPARDYRIDVHSASDVYLCGHSSRFTIDDEHRARCVQIATALLGLPPHLRLPYPILRSICMQAATV